jgi:chromosome segregation ATPase
MTTRQNRWEKERHGFNARIRELESPASESERNQFQEQLAALSEKITRLENDINTKDDEISRLRLASPAKEKRSKAWVDTRKKRDRDDEEGGSGSKKPAGKKNKKGK